MQLPLSRQFSIILTIFAIFTIIILLYSSFGYAKLQTDTLNKSLESYSAQLAKSTRESYESYENICYSIAYNQTVQNYLTKTAAQTTALQYEQYQQLNNLLTNTANLNPYITDIAVYGQDGTFASLCSPSSNYEEFAQSFSDSRFPYQSAGTAVINKTDCHIMAMPIYTLGTGESRYLGIMFLAVDVNSLFGNSLYDTQNDYNPLVVFTDSGNQLIYGDSTLYETLNSTENGSDMFQVTTASPTVNYAVIRYRIPGIDHTLYVLVSRSQFHRQVVRISLRLILGMGCLIAVVLLLLFLLYRPMIRSLNQLTGFMKSISKGNRKVARDGFTIEQGWLETSEITEITKAFNDMLVESDRLNHTIFDTYTRMYEMEANNRKTEIAFLRSQVNPHFLYNTLTMICGMAAESKMDKIISVTGALSQIFRYSIKGSDIVTLREEMEIVKSYLMIQEERFENRFTIRYEFSEDSYACLIPKMVIQPIVENAIVHGLEQSLKPGELLIGAGRNPEFGYLAIWIFDTGVGMSADKLEELRADINLSVSQKSGEGSAHPSNMDTEIHDSIGLRNVNSRMVLYYGAEYTLLIDSEENVGTNIQLRVPYQVRESDINDILK